MKKFLVVTALLVSCFLRAQDCKTCRDYFRNSAYHQANKCFSEIESDLPAQVLADYAESLLGAGYYIEGFNLFEKRLEMSADASKRDKVKRVDLLVNPWNGSDPAGKTILVREEMGIGDLFFFSRYMAELKRLGATVIFHLGGRGFLKRFS